MHEQFRRPLLSPTTRGVHHLALCTDDMKATIDFYVDVLGMPLVHAMKVPPGLGTGPRNRGNPPYERVRHYFFDMGNDSLLAFFEIPKGEEPAGNRNAIGARVEIEYGGQRQVRFVNGGGSYLSANDRRVLAGLGTTGRAERVLVTWPSGRKQEFRDLEARRCYRLHEAQEQAVVVTPRKPDRK